MRKFHGNNSGYEGYSMSKRAIWAYEAGKRPYSKLPAWAKKLVDVGLVTTDEWHHTSSYGNETPFYNISQFDILTEEEKNSLGVDWNKYQWFGDVPKEVIKKLNEKAKHFAIKKQEAERTAVAIKKELDEFNKKFKKFIRIQQIPKYGVVEKVEMYGKYGWFDASYKYNLPRYYSGVDYETEENYKVAETLQMKLRDLNL